MYGVLGPKTISLMVVACLAVGARSAAAEDGTGLADEQAYASFSLQGDSASGGSVEQTEVVTTEAPANPFSFNVTYYLYSDYVFRGINFSEYGGEGRERLNHQMTTDVSVDLGALLSNQPGAYGTFSFGTFFEWFAGQKSIDPIHGGQNLQEVDYLLAWSYDVAPLATTVTLGFTFYAFPNAKSINTQEWSIGLEHNDAWMWKWLWPDNEDGVLNPSFFFAQDVGITDGGSWMELGISHDFPVFEDFTLSPSLLLAIDHRYLDPLAGTGRDGTTRLAYLQYGLTATYDMTRILRLPESLGSMELSGFLYFNDALGTAEDDDTIQDEFYGGMSVGWTF